MFKNNIILTLACLGLFQALLLCVYLITLKKRRKKATNFLILVLFGLTIRIGKSVLNYYIPLVSWQRNIGISGIFIVGPSLWFYITSLVDKEKVITYKHYIHYAPFLFFILFLYMIPSNGEFANYWNYGIVVFHLVIYLIISWFLLFDNKNKISKAVFAWCKNILIGVSLVWFYYLGNFLSFNLHYITGPIFYTFLIYAFSYLFLNRINFNLDKYNSSTIDSNTSKKLYKKINTLFINEKVFLDPTVSLSLVAKKIGISARIVSQVINENKEQNFQEFVNHYRIENAKDLLLDSKYINEKIATVAYDSGFGTVASFNVAFKRNTGKTPSLYKKYHLSK